MLLLSEKECPYTAEVLDVDFDSHDSFYSYAVPVLVDGSVSVAGIMPISRFLDEKIPRHKLFSEDFSERLLQWQIMDFFSNVLYQDSIRGLLDARFNRNSRVSTEGLRRLRDVLRECLDILEIVVTEGMVLGNGKLSQADLLYGAYISCLDYLGEVVWRKYPAQRDFYMSLKCRPSFRPIIEEWIAACTPPPHYTMLDF